MIKLFIIGFSTDKGGVESYITNLCSNLDRDIYNVIFCWPEMVIDGKKWITPKNRHNYFSYRKFWKRFFKENSFDVVYFNTCDIVSIDMLKFAKRANVKVRIIHSHSTDNQFKLRFHHRILERINRKNISNYANVLLACSKEAGEWMFPYNEFVVINNGIDLDKYSYNNDYRLECRSELNLNDEYVIGCLGRLDEQKNPIRTFKVFENIIQKNPNIHCVFVGAGYYEEQIKQLIVSSKYKDNIHFMGPRDDAYKWYSAFDCLIMPSYFEGLPFSLIEAQCSGLPCVVSSAVSNKANICGLLNYVDLDESDDRWSDAILSNMVKERGDTKVLLTEKGYNIKQTSKEVQNIIEGILYENNN